MDLMLFIASLFLPGLHHLMIKLKGGSSAVIATVCKLMERVVNCFNVHCPKNNSYQYPNYCTNYGKK